MRSNSIWRDCSNGQFLFQKEEVTSGKIVVWQSSLSHALASASASARYTWVGNLWSASGFDLFKREEVRRGSHRNEDPRLIILGFSRLTVFGVSVHLVAFTFYIHLPFLFSKFDISATRYNFSDLSRSDIFIGDVFRFSTKQKFPRRGNISKQAASNIWQFFD